MSVDHATQAPTGESQFVPYTVFPNTGMRILSATLHFTGSSILAYCVARRAKTVRVASVNDLKALSWARLCVVIILVISWMFIFATGILIHGVGLSSSHNACSSGIFMCIWLYALTKVFIYAFLTEKVRVVWDIVAQPRLSSPVYLVCILVMLPFGAMPVMMTIGRIAFFQPNMACVIGLKPFASIALLGYDLFTNVFLNAMFLWPLLRSNLINPRLRIVARRTLVAAIAALATSATNVAVVAVLKHELGWVCLASCTTDVTLNALVIFWLTIPTANTFPNDPAFMLGQLSTQQPTSSQNRPDASVKAPIVIFTPTMVQQPEASLNSPIIGKTVDILVPDQLRATEDHEYQDSTSLSGFPVSPTMASTSAGNVSIPTNSSGDDLNCVRRPIGLRSLGERFGLSRRKSEQEVEVHVSVVTQHDVELGGLGDERTNQDDSGSLHQTELASKWYE